MAEDRQSVRGQPHLKGRIDNRAPALELPASSLYPRASNLQKAKKKLIATHPNSKIELTDWKQRPLTISNRNRIRLCSSYICSVSLLLPGVSVPVREDEFSIQLRPPSPQNLIANEIIESPVTPSKQMTQPRSNREKLQGAPKYSLSSFRSPRASRLTWVAEILARAPHSHFLHSYCDACNIPPTKSGSGVYFLKRFEDVIASDLALLIVRDVSNLNQTARGRRMKK